MVVARGSMCRMTAIDLIGTEEAARLLGLGRSALVQRAHRGAIEPYAVIGEKGVMVFERSYVEAYAARERERRLARARARRTRA